MYVVVPFLSRCSQLKLTHSYSCRSSIVSHRHRFPTRDPNPSIDSSNLPSIHSTRHVLHSSPSVAALLTLSVSSCFSCFRYSQPCIFLVPALNHLTPLPILCYVISIPSGSWNSGSMARSVELLSIAKQNNMIFDICGFPIISRHARGALQSLDSDREQTIERRKCDLSQQFSFRFSRSLNPTQTSPELAEKTQDRYGVRPSSIHISSVSPSPFYIHLIHPSSNFASLPAPHGWKGILFASVASQ